MSERKKIWGSRIFLVSFWCSPLIGLWFITSAKDWSIWPVSSHRVILPILMVAGWVVLGILAVVTLVWFWADFYPNIWSWATKGRPKPSPEQVAAAVKRPNYR